MSTLGLTFDRTSLDLADLTFTSAPPSGDGFWIESIDNPAFDFRRSYAPDSMWVPGKLQLAAVLDQESLPATVHGRASTAADLSALRDELTAAVAQFSYDVTLTLDGISTTWSADCSMPGFGAIDSGEQDELFFTATLVIPVNPLGAP